VTTVTSPAVVADEATRAAPSRRKMRKKKRSIAVRVLQFLVIVALFGSWQLLAVTKVLNPSFVSEPSEFFPSFWHGVVSGSLLSLMGATLYATFVGFAAAAVLGLLAGYLFAEFKVLDMVARPFMTGFNSVPRIALAPLFVLWFGLGSLSVIVLIVSLAFFIVSFNTYAGLQSCSRDHLLLARTLGAGRFVRFTKFVLPSATPAIFAGLQLALTYAFLGAVVGEMLQGSQGLGGYLALQMGTFETTGFFGGLTLLIIVALIVAGVVRAVEKHLLRWQAYELRGTQG
jgi:NitT/TauT family transport system permease protein